MDSKRKALIERLIADARKFRFCGPSDDPDEQTAVTAGYRYLVVQFKNIVAPILPESQSIRLKSIEVDFDDIYSAYAARAELDSLIPDIESAIDRVDVQAVPRQPLSALFVNHASNVLADTNNGLTGTEIVKMVGAFAIDFNVTIPHSSTPLSAPNKRTALSENLMAFSESQRYSIIRHLCDYLSTAQRNADAVRKLKLMLMTRYGYFDAERLGNEVNEDLLVQTRHWLDSFPDVLELFNQALEKYAARVFVRNLLDDLRLALEKLVQSLVGSSKSLENQLPAVGAFVKERGGSPELSNMFAKLLDYYCKYQNSYVKHDDAVIEEELEFVIEITSAFMKHLIRLAGREVF